MRSRLRNHLPVIVCLIFLGRIVKCSGQNATKTSVTPTLTNAPNSTSSTISSSRIIPSSTTPTSTATASINSTVQPTSRGKKNISTTVASTLMPTTVVPIERTYIFSFTVGEPWKETYTDTTEVRSLLRRFGPSLLAQFERIFRSAQLSEFKSVELHEPNVIVNDNGKLRLAVKATFGPTVSMNRNDPESSFRNATRNGVLSLNVTLVPRTVHVTEHVPGYTFTNWTKPACGPSCCGGHLIQMRTCSNVNDGCVGVPLFRSMVCEQFCPITCGQVRIFKFNVTLTNEPWKDTYSSDYTEIYKTIYNNDNSVIKEVEQIFTNNASTPGLQTVRSPRSNVDYFYNDKGNVRALFVVKFGPASPGNEDPESYFVLKTKNGKLGKFNIDRKTLSVVETAEGYKLTTWQTPPDKCDECCGGVLAQTRSCTAKVGKCDHSLVKRNIECSYVCDEVYCSGSSSNLPYRVLICAVLFNWMQFGCVAT